MTESDYPFGRLSPSKAPLLLPPSCPAIFRYQVDNPIEPTPAMVFGTLVHTLLLGEGPEIVVLDPEIHGRKRDGTIAEKPSACTAWKQAEAEARTRDALAVSRADYNKAQAMVNAVMEHPIAAPLFESGHPEHFLEIDDPLTGVRLRGRLDWMTMIDGRVIVVDFKTGVTANPWAWTRKASDYGYEIQDAWYRALIRLLGIDDDPQFCFVVAEKEPPHLVSVIELPARAVLLGATKMRDAIDIYHRCYTTDTWPGWDDRIYTEDLAPWAYKYSTPIEEEWSTQ